MFWRRRPLTTTSFNPLILVILGQNEARVVSKSSLNKKPVGGTRVELSRFKCKIILAASKVVAPVVASVVDVALVVLVVSK